MKKTLISSLIAIAGAAIPLYAFADEGESRGRSIVTVTPGEEVLPAERPGDKEDALTAAPAAPPGSIVSAVDPNADPLRPRELSLSALISVYDTLRQEITEGPIGIISDTLRPEWDRLTGLKTGAEEKCTAYVTAMQGMEGLYQQRKEAIDTIAAETDITAREKATRIFDSIKESLELEQKQTNDLYTACQGATEEFRWHMDTFANQLKTNLLETDAQKVERARNAAGSLIVPVQADVSRLEGRVNSVENRLLSLQPLVGMEGHGNGNQFLAGAGLCYGNAWQLCAQAMAYFGGTPADSSTSSSTPGRKTFEGGYAEDFTRGMQSDVVRSYQASVGAEVRTPNLLSSLDWTLELGVAGRLFQGEETSTTETTRRSQYVNGNGGNVGDPVTISNKEEETTRFRNVSGEVNAAVCYGQVCLKGAAGLDSDDNEIVRGTLEYRF